MMTVYLGLLTGDSNLLNGLVHTVDTDIKNLSLMKH